MHTVEEIEKLFCKQIWCKHYTTYLIKGQPMSTVISLPLSLNNICSHLHDEKLGLSCMNSSHMKQ